MVAPVSIAVGPIQITLAGQSMTFLTACALGVALGMLYDVFRISRKAFALPGIVIAVEDLLFFFICAFVSFAYLMNATDGSLRWFIAIGELLGATLYYYTVGELVMAVSDAVLEMIRRLLRWIWRLTGAPLLRLARRIGRHLCRLGKRSANLTKKAAEKNKKRLKQKGALLYTFYSAHFLKKGTVCPKRGERRNGKKTKKTQG